MSIEDLSDWMTLHANGDQIWYAKRLAANDTLATGSHQAGPYVPKDLLFKIFPQLNDHSRQNPDIDLVASIASHGLTCEVRVIWYNNRLFGGTRNEARITNWGGIASPLLDPESTGALAIFVFYGANTDRPAQLHVWVCRNDIEEELVEGRLGVVEPSHYLIWTSDGLVDRQSVKLTRAVLPCRLTLAEIPNDWLSSFPAGAEFVRMAVERRPLRTEAPDRRLVVRRACEYEIFLSVEEVIEGPRITQGFKTVDDFVGHAQSILQRRKSRSGRSLELHAREIFVEEGMKEGVDFSHQPESDPGKKPDFLFPSEAAYKNLSYPTTQLRLLAAKTTCKDRWRQVINEGSRIATKHLLTLQEGVSVNQFAEMEAAGIKLVVPMSLTDSYPEEIRPRLVTLTEFIHDVRSLVTPDSAR